MSAGKMKSGCHCMKWQRTRLLKGQQTKLQIEDKTKASKMTVDEMAIDKMTKLTIDLDVLRLKKKAK